MDLIGRRGKRPRITPECVFVDTVADIAVLGPPDSQMFGEAREQYEAFLVGLPPFDVMAPPPRSRLRMSSFPDGQPIFPTLGSVTFPGHVLPLEGPWISCKVMYSGGLLSILPNDRAEGEELAEAESGQGRHVGLAGDQRDRRCARRHQHQQLGFHSDRRPARLATAQAGVRLLKTRIKDHEWLHQAAWQEQGCVGA